MSGVGAGHEEWLNARHNITVFHREHMRFNATLLLEVAADLSREANRLKVFGDYWRRQPDALLTGAFDAADPKFGAAGCPDLNPVSAVAGAGILFMEGFGEPEEIRLLKEKLHSEGTRFVNKGQWLIDRMETSSAREYTLIDPVDPGLWPRVAVVSLTWQGAKQRKMAGQLLLTAHEYLAQVDFSPAGIRADRARAGTTLLSAAWTIDTAAALFCENASSLTRDDLEMTQCLEYFNALNNVDDDYTRGESHAIDE